MRALEIPLNYGSRVELLYDIELFAAGPVEKLCDLLLNLSWGVICDAEDQPFLSLTLCTGLLLLLLPRVFFELFGLRI